MNENELSSIVIGEAIKVHQNLGPGLLESVYQQCLIKELSIRGISVKSSVPIPLVYKNFILNKRLRQNEKSYKYYKNVFQFFEN